MGEIEDSGTGGGSEGGIAPKTFVARSIGCALQASWLPAATYFLSVNWVDLPMLPTVLMGASFLGAALAMAVCLLVRRLPAVAERVGAWRGRGQGVLSLAQFAVLSLGLGLLVLAWAYRLPDQFLVGAASSLGLALCCAALACESRNQVAVSACVMVLAFSTEFLLAGALGIETSSACAFVANGLSLVLLRVPGKVCDDVCADGLGIRGEGAVLSNLYRARRRNLLGRFWASFFVMGAMTSVMIGLFVAGIRTPAAITVQAYGWMGTVAFVLLLVAGWLYRHGFSFPLSFSFLTLLALVVFFPFLPSSQFNQHLSLVFSECWVLCLLGMLVLMVWEMRSPVGRDLLYVCTLGCSALFTGVFVGLVAFGGLWEAFWASGWLATTFERTLFVTTCGSLTIAATYLCTNVLVNERCIRSVRLLARGRFEILAPASAPRPVAVGAGQPGAAAPEGSQEPEELSLGERCRRITLERKLTPREFDVLLLLAQGNGLSKVQEDLVISKGTAITHRRNIYRKLDVHSRQELITYVAQFPGEGEQSLP